MSSLTGVTGHQQFPGVAHAYQRSFARLCAGTVDTIVADLGSPGSGQLLDAGCGTGNVSRTTARLGWAVTAFDADAQMLEVARAESGGLPIQWVQSALPQSGLRAGAFDAVVANFVVNNVTDPRAAAGELARVVRPGGVVALTAWVSERATHIGLILEAFQAAGLPEPRLRRPAEVDFERTVGGLTSLAHRSGLETVQSRELTWDWTISWDDLWVGLVASMGQPYLALNASAQDRVREQLQRRTRALEADGQIHLPSVAAYVLAGAKPRSPGGHQPSPLA
jgi:ubiquinone/menaquinone biosynthesis C-methylase UbiE